MSTNTCNVCCLVIGFTGFLCVLVSLTYITDPLPQAVTRANYRYFNFSDLNNSVVAKIYMADLLYNFTKDCRHLSCASLVLDHVLESIKPSSPEVGIQFKGSS
jgi:hypothetical protein